jgi:hypothetical protein
LRQLHFGVEVHVDVEVVTELGKASHAGFLSLLKPSTNIRPPHRLDSPGNFPGGIVAVLP